MPKKPEAPRKADQGKKPYEKPELKRMNPEHPAVVTGRPPVPGAPASAQASPIAPGATVF
jgi:hypothetical protein